METAKFPKVCLNGIRQPGNFDHFEGRGGDRSQGERVEERSREAVGTAGKTSLCRNLAVKGAFPRGHMKSQKFKKNFY